MEIKLERISSEDSTHDNTVGLPLKSSSMLVEWWVKSCDEGLAWKKYTPSETAEYGLESCFCNYLKNLIGDGRFAPMQCTANFTSLVVLILLCTRDIHYR